MANCIKATELRILMASSSYPSNARDWQGRFIANMATAISQQQNIQLALWAPPGDLPPGVNSALYENDGQWLGKLLKAGGIAHLLRGNPVKGAWIAFGLLRRLWQLYRRERFDVAHINWLQNALPLWRSSTPTLITVLGSDFGLLKLPGMTWLLRQVLKGRKCIIAPNAAWMAPDLERRFGDIAEIRPIPFGVQSHWFDLQRTPAQPHRWLVVTRLTKNKIGDLFDWGNGLFGKQRELHLFGPMQEEVLLPDWVIWHGPTNPDELASDWFPTATGLITLSHHDEGRPQVMLEAMAAGLPVIASKLPAHEDFVHHRQTGWLADSPEDFAKALEQMELPETNQRMGVAARTYIRDGIGDWDECAKRYVNAYQDLLECRHV